MICGLLSAQVDMWSVPSPLKFDTLIVEGIRYLNREALDSVSMVAHQFQKMCPEHPVGYFLLADTYQTLMRRLPGTFFRSGIRWSSQLRRGSWFKALLAAVASIRALKTARKMASEFVEPLLGLAMYDYAQSKIFFGIFKNKSQDAINKLQKVRAHSEFLSVNATHFFRAKRFLSGDGLE